jgi:hypothetical protein
MHLAVVLLTAVLLGAPAFALPPPNDNLANALLLTPRGGDVFISGTNSEATVQPQEPLSPVGPYKSVWYRIAAPSAGTTLDITTDGSSFDTTLVLYRGNPAGGFLKLSRVDEDDDGGDVGLGSRITTVVPDSSGLDYLIAVDGFNGASGDIYLDVDITPPPPANDNFANSQLVTIPTGGVSVFGNNLGATRQTGEPTSHGDEKSVWYRIDPAAAGKGIRITSAGTEFSASLAVYRGTYAAGVSSLQLVDEGSRVFDDLGDYERVEFVMPTGSSDSYFLALGSFVGGDDFTLNFTTFTAPTNDAFVNAHLVTVPNGGLIVSGSNLDATRQTGEPTDHGDEKSVWYRVAPATAGRGIRITSAGSLLDPDLAVYRGTFAAGVSALQLVEQGSFVSSGSGGYEQIDFLIPPGSSDSYFLALGSFRDGGNFQLNFTTFTGPTNDAFANAQLVTVPTGGIAVAGTNQGATRETNEPATHGDKKSVWYRIAPSTASRGIRITSTGSEFLPNFSVYRGSIAGGLSALQVVDVGASVTSGGVTHRQVDFVMPASPTEDYFFAVGTTDLSGSLQLNFTTFTAPANDLFANAQLVTVPPGGITVAGSTVGASRQTSEPTSHGSAKSVWYRIASSAAGKGILVTSLGSQFVPEIAVYRGSTAAGITSLQLVETASSANAQSEEYKRVDFVIPTGTADTYFVAVGSSGSRGDIQLNFTTFTAPANDAFANAQLVTIPAGGVAVSGSNLGATTQASEPTNHGSRKSVWYRIDPAAAGKVVLVSSTGNVPSPNLAIYRGSIASGLSALQVVGSGSQLLDFLIPAGSSDTFFVAVGSFSSGGTFQLNFSSFVPPANDNVAGAAPITVTFGNATITGNTFGATADDPEDGSRSVWYRMAAPPAGTRLLVLDENSNIDAFVGNPANGFASLTPVSGPYDSGNAFAGPLGPSEVYLIRVSGSAGSFEFTVVAPPTLIITGVIDGPLPGGLPKAVELFALEDIPNLGAYWVGVANDGGGTDGPEVNLTGALAKGEFYYVSNEAPKFQSFFGFAADLVSTNLSFNGNDAIELFYYPSGSTPGTQITMDTFGVPGVNGSGQAWEYTGSWAYRNVATTPDEGTFVPSHWRYLGPGGLAGKTTNAPITATSFPLGTYLSGELLFPALEPHPFERFDGDDDRFDLDHKTLTLVPVNAGETDPDKWAYHYTVSDGAVPWLDLAALDPDSQFFDGSDDDPPTFDYPVSFPFFGSLRSGLTVNDGARLEFDGASERFILPVPQFSSHYGNSIRIGEVGESTVIQSEWGIHYFGFIFELRPGPSRYQVELFPSGMIRISFHGVRSSSGKLGIVEGGVEPLEVDFSAASLKFSPAVLQESAAGAPMVALPRPQPSNLAYSLLATPISAVPGEDYLVSSGSGIVTSNGSPTAMPISILNDAFSEQDERIEVILRDPVDPAWILGRTDFWIIDNDTSAQSSNNPVLQIVGDRVRITPSTALTPAGNYQVRIRNIQGGGVFGSDGRTLLEGALVSLTEAATGLGISSSRVTFSVEFILVSNGGVVGKSFHRYTRTGSQPTFRFSGPSSVTIQEGKILSLPIELLDAGNLDNATTFSVNHQLVPITAIRFSANTGDFIVLPAEVQNGARTIEIPIVADGIAEGNETFEVRLINPSPGAILGTPSVVTVTIQSPTGTAVEGTSPFVQVLPTDLKSSSITLGVGANDWRFAGDAFWTNGPMTLLVRRPGLYVTRYPNGESETVLNGMPLEGNYNYQNIVFPDPNTENVDGPVPHDIEVPARIGTGSLQVVLEPTSGRWRRLGQSTWRSSGFTETGVANGLQFVEFDNNVSNNFAPPLLKVNVVTGTTSVTAKYQPKQSSAPTSVLSTLESTLDTTGYPKVADTTGAGVNESNDWVNIPFASQSGEFALICDVQTDYLSVGSTVLIDSIVGLSSSANTDNWNEVSAVARALRSDATGNYFWDSHTGGPSCSSNCFTRLDEVLVLDDTQYRLRFLVNVPAKTFSVEIEFAGSEWITVVKNAPFRASATSLGYLTLRNVQGKIRLLAPPRVVPYTDHFAGRIESSRGFGSGTVVAKRAVLTSADLVFDRDNLSFYDDIVWRCSAGQAGLVPEVNEPSGAFLPTAYAEGLLAETADSTIRDAQNVAVLGFIERIHPNLPGSGGYSGIRIDDGSGSWKTSGVAKRMPFFPFSSVSTENLGKMHFLDANSVTFTSQGHGVFSASSGFSPPPGAEGAALFVRLTNGVSLPAAVYLGSRSGVSLFRQIDEKIAMAVNAAAGIEDQVLADGGHILFDQDSSKGGIYYIEAGLGERKDPDDAIIDAKNIPAAIIWRIESKKENETYGGGARIGVDPWFDYTLTFPAAPPGYVLDPLVLKDPVARTIKHVPVKGGTWTIPPVYLPDSTDYQTWKTRNYSTAEILESPTARWGVDSTDMALFIGVENVVAYAFGFDPKAGTTRYADPGSMTPGFPILRRNTSNGPLYFEFLRRKDENLRYIIESNTALSGTWTEVDASWPKTPASLEGGGSNSVWEHVRYPLSQTGPRKFMRLRVTLLVE